MPDYSLRNSADIEAGLDQCICNGPGVFHSVQVGNPGCCQYLIYDKKSDGTKRPLIRFPFGIGGSFYCKFGFVNGLWVDMTGHMPCHLRISYSPAPKRRKAA